MNIPAQILIKLNEEFDLAPILLLDNNNCLDNSTVDAIIQNEDTSTVLKMLKIKLIMIYKNKSSPSDYDLTALLRTLHETNLNMVHDVLFYAMLIQQSSNVLQNLLEESYNNLSDIDKKDSQLINFNLEILDVIIEICSLTENDLLKTYSANKNINELFINLLCTQEKDVQIKIVKDVIAKYISCTKNFQIIALLWDTLRENPFFYEYVLFVLEEYFMPDSQKELKFSILDQTEFWMKLQTNLISGNSFVKKQTVYLLKTGIQILLKSERYIEKYTTNHEIVNDLIKWNENKSEEFQKAWKNFFILCDTSNEKQLHLIKPTFQLYNTLEILHDSWRKCISILFITHSHSAVVLHTVSQILTKNWSCDLDTLLNALNNNFLYDSSEDKSIFPDLLESYISRLCPKDFEKFAELLAKRQPSPVPFYYICKSLARYQEPEVAMKILIDLVYSTEKVPHLYIRKAIQDSLFSLLTKTSLHDKHFRDEVLFQELLTIVYLFNNIGYFKRKRGLWSNLLKWLHPARSILGEKLVDTLNHMSHDFKFSPQLYAVWNCIAINMDFICDNLDDSMTRIQVTSDYAQKLRYSLISHHAIKIKSFEQKSERLDCIGTEDLSMLLAEILSICIHMKNQCHVDIINNIEFMIDVTFSNDYNRTNCHRFLTHFLDELKIAGLYDWYIILSKKIMQLCDKTEIIENYKNGYFLKVKESIKEAKDICLSGENVLDNSTKRQLLSNYYYTEMCLAKILLSDGNTITLKEISDNYDKAGTEILVPILNTLLAMLNRKDTASSLAETSAEYCNLLHRLQTDILRMRSDEMFRPAFAKLVKIVTHPCFSCNDELRKFRDQFCTAVFDPSQTVTGLRNEILQQAVFENKLMISVQILVEALLYGPVLRKDQRIEFEACAKISSYYSYNDYMQELDPDIVNPCELDGKVRSQGVCVLLQVIQHQIHGKSISEQVWRLVKEKYDQFANKRYFGDSQLHFLKLRVIQTLHLLIDSLDEDDADTMSQWLMDCLIKESQQPSVKLLIQWLLVRICLEFFNNELAVIALIKLLKNLPGTSCTSVFPILYHVVKGKDIVIKVVEHCMNTLLTYTMGQHFNIRYCAQVTIKYIYEVYEIHEEFRTKYSSIYETICDVIKQTTTDKSFDKIPTYTNLPLSLETIYYDIPRLTNVTNTEWLPTEYFQSLVNNKLAISTTDNILQQLQTNRRKTITPPSDSVDGSTNVQKKIDPFSAQNFSNDQCEVASTVNANFIVVASLIDRAPNLGGLSRTCEVFGVKQYVLNNVQFVKNKEYQSLSMSSEKWVDTIEVKVKNLPAYLKEMKKNGYAIVGAEQTADSQKLDSFHFEKNTVLLLGNEKEGIPPNLIHLLDQCIEIPQFGQIRSLNVHVAGALFIWEYAKQHCKNC